MAAFSRNFEKTLIAKGLPVSPEIHDASAVGADEFIYWNAYTNGIAGYPVLLNKIDDSGHWSLKFDAPVGGKPLNGESTLAINFATLRYRFGVQLEGMTQAADFYGRCEPIP